MQLRPLNPHIGVEVSGLDLKRPIDGATAAALRGALNEHLLLLLRGQDVSADEQNEFGRVFGEVHLRTKYSVPVAVPLAQFVSTPEPGEEARALLRALDFAHRGLR